MSQTQSALGTLVSNMQSQSSNRLPAQPFTNPKDNVSAMTLRSIKELGAPPVSKKDVESEKEVSETPKTKDQNESEKEKGEEPKSKKHQEMTLEDFNKLPHYVPRPPFPHRYAQPKRDAANGEILETFRKVEINIPLLDAIKQVPRYAKFLKELCTNKRKLKGNEKISVGENLSAVFQKKLPPKCKDPGMFSIPCKIGHNRFNRCMLDLGASINVMPRSVYDSLNF